MNGRKPIARFKLTYRDSENTVHFSFFTQFFTLSLKITIPKQHIKGKSFVLNRETKFILLLPLGTILVPMSHVL